MDRDGNWVVRGGRGKTLDNESENLLEELCPHGDCRFMTIEFEVNVSELFREKTVHGNAKEQD